MGEYDKDKKANSGDQRPPSINRRAVLRGAVATGASGALAGCLGSFEREYEATPATVPEETASEHNLAPDPEIKKRSGTITQGLGVATLEAKVTGYTATYEHQGNERQTEEPTTEPASTPTPTPVSTPTPTATPEPTPTPTDPQTAPADDDDDDGEDDQEASQTPMPTAVTFTDKELERSEDGFVAVVDRVRLNQGGFIALRKGNLSGDVLGVSDYLEPGEHINVRVRLDESISGDVTLVAVARKDDGNETFDLSTDMAYTTNGQPVSGSAVVQLPDGPSVGPVEPDTLNINSTPNPNFVGQSLNPAATTSIENLIEEETEAFQQACNCTIDNPDQVEVKSVDPANAQLSEDDIGTTVFHLDKESAVLADVPTSTELLGNEKPIELFLVPSSGETENTVKTNIVAATKATGQLESGTSEAVVASYISTTSLHFEMGIHLIQPDTSNQTPTPTSTPPETPSNTSESAQGEATTVTSSQVKKAADQLSGVCPSVTGGSGETTASPTPMATPQERIIDLCERYNELILQKKELKQQRDELLTRFVLAKNELEGLWRAHSLLKFKEQVQTGDGEQLQRKQTLLETDYGKSYPQNATAKEIADSLKPLWNNYGQIQSDYEQISRQYERSRNKLKEFLQEHGATLGVPVEPLPPRGGQIPRCESTIVGSPTPTPTPTPTPETPVDEDCRVRWRCQEGSLSIKAVTTGDGAGDCDPVQNGHAWITIGKKWIGERICDGETTKRWKKLEWDSFGFYPKTKEGESVNPWDLEGTVKEMEGKVRHTSDSRSQGPGNSWACSYTVAGLSCSLTNQIRGKFLRLSDPNQNDPPGYSAIPADGENCSSWAVNKWNETLNKHSDSSAIRMPEDGIKINQYNPCDDPRFRPNILCEVINNMK